VCLVFHVHQSVFRKHLSFPLSAILCWVEAVLMPLAFRGSRFVAISSDTKRELHALGVPEGQIDLALSGVDPDLRPLPKSPQPTIAYVGRLKAYKRIEKLLDAVPALAQRFPDLRVVIAGTGDHDAALKAYATGLGVADRVVFEGFVDEARKREILGSAWLFVMPSEMEGWGLTIVEAAACGTPSVGYDVPGVREAIVDGQTGAVVPNGSDLAPILIALLGNHERRSTLADGARMASRSFSWDRTTDAMLDSVQRAVLQEYGRLVSSSDGTSPVTTSATIAAFPKSANVRRQRSRKTA
jgi:glycosyltransferase involved in cell wall biosynthesis